MVKLVPRVLRQYDIPEVLLRCVATSKAASHRPFEPPVDFLTMPLDLHGNEVASTAAIVDEETDEVEVGISVAQGVAPQPRADDVQQEGAVGRDDLDDDSEARPSLDVSDRERMARVLFLEEAQHRHNIRRYDLVTTLRVPDARSDGGKHYVQLFVEGLAEKRPSVIAGDVVELCPVESLMRFYSVVDRTEEEQVILRVKEQAAAIARGGGQFHVTFTVSRRPFQLQHRAIWNCRAVLTHDFAARQRETHPEWRPYLASSPAGRQILFELLNVEQQKFVREAFCDGEQTTMLLHGPPGTGKTTTIVALVDALLAVAADTPRSGAPRVLVTTPSNASADLVVERLLVAVRARRALVDRAPPAQFTTEIVRAQAASRELIGCSADVVAHSVNLSRRFGDVDRLSRATVVVSTLVSAGAIYSLGMPKGHFTHFIIDEAGQCTDVEALIPLCLADQHSCRVVLAGDHLQLGAVVTNNVARRQGLGVSPLERLQRHPEMKGQNMHVLVRNYRSHPDILACFNPTYNNSLLCCGDRKSREIGLLNPTDVKGQIPCGLFRQQRAPLAFMHVEGTENRARGSPSWQNLDESRIVASVVNALLGSPGVTAADIVVLTPYVQQRRVISRAVPRGVLVCSVEQYQGREAPIVVISCVRSKRVEEVAADRRMALGFLRQPQRVNVAVSRASAGMVIVGNAAALAVLDSSNDDVRHAAERLFSGRRPASSAAAPPAPATRGGGPPSHDVMRGGAWGRLVSHMLRQGCLLDGVSGNQMTPASLQAALNRYVESGADALRRQAAASVAECAVPQAAAPTAVASPAPIGSLPDVAPQQRFNSNTRQAKVPVPDEDVTKDAEMLRSVFVSAQVLPGHKGSVAASKAHQTTAAALLETGGW